MTPALLTLLTFLAVVLAVVGVYSVLSDLYLRDRARASKRVDDELRKRHRDRIQKSSVFKNLSPISAEAPADLDRPPTFRERFVIMVEQSGLSLTANRLLAYMGGGAAAGGLLGWVVRQSALAALAAAAVGAVVPYLFVVAKRKSRLEKLMRQLPDAFDLMSRVIRAGQTMSQALMAVADEFDQPGSGEFAYCYEQQNLGLSPEVALRDLARRTGLLEIRIFVLALLVQQQTGGNLAELLDRLAGLIRERFRMKGKIRALTAEGRAQAALLLVLPILLLFGLAAFSKDYADALALTPNLIVYMLVLEGIGALWIRRIVNFDF